MQLMNIVVAKLNNQKNFNILKLQRRKLEGVA